MKKIILQVDVQSGRAEPLQADGGTKARHLPGKGPSEELISEKWETSLWCPPGLVGGF